MIVVDPTQSSAARAARLRRDLWTRGNSPGILRQNRPTRASHSIFHSQQSTFLFSHCYALFCTAQNPNSFRFILFRTLCAKHPGWVYPILRHHRTSPPTVIPSVARISAPSRALCAMNLLLSFPHASPVTDHRSPAANSFRIRTSGKHVRNPIGMNSSKTQDLKLFRIRTYEKTRGRGPYRQPDTRRRRAAQSDESRGTRSSLLYVATSLLQIFTQLHSFEYGTRLIRYPDFTPVTT